MEQMEPLANSKSYDVWMCILMEMRNKKKRALWYENCTHAHMQQCRSLISAG